MTEYLGSIYPFSWPMCSFPDESFRFPFLYWNSYWNASFYSLIQDLHQAGYQFIIACLIIFDFLFEHLNLAFLWLLSYFFICDLNIFTVIPLNHNACFSETDFVRFVPFSPNAIYNFFLAWKYLTLLIYVED